MPRTPRIFGIIFIEGLFWFVAAFGLGGFFYFNMTGRHVDWRLYWATIMTASAMGSVLLAFMVAAVDWIFMKKLAENYAIKDPPVVFKKELSLEISTEEAGEFVRAALAEIGARNITEKEEGVIKAFKPFSFKTSGEKIEVSFYDEAGGAVVKIKSRPRLRGAFVDFGQNALNVKRFEAALIKLAGKKVSGES